MLCTAFEGRSVLNGAEAKYRERILEEGAAVYAQGTVAVRDGAASFPSEGEDFQLAPSRAAMEQRTLSRTMLGLLFLLVGLSLACGAVLVAR